MTSSQSVWAPRVKDRLGRKHWLKPSCAILPDCTHNNLQLMTHMTRVNLCILPHLPTLFFLTSPPLHPRPLLVPHTHCFLSSFLLLHLILHPPPSTSPSLSPALKETTWSPVRPGRQTHRHTDRCLMPRYHSNLQYVSSPLLISTPTFNYYKLHAV